MAFNWNTKKPDKELVKQIDIIKQPIEMNQCNLFCTSDSPTCANLTREEFDAQQRIPACWDSIGNLVLDDQ